jgi:hypothetical protein
LDSKSIRTKLDEAGLSRSSNLRIVLTRISRDSISMKEFLSSVNHEVEKIVDPDELKNLKEDKRLSSMSYVIELLLEKLN